VNLPVPPRWLRRVLIAPLVMAVAFGILTSLPLLVIGAAAASPFLPGSWRALRLLAFALAYLAIELLGLLAAFGLWIGSGFGYKMRTQRFIDLHYRLLRWALGALVAVAERVFTVSIVEDPGREISSVTGRERPMIILSRHAGPGDSFLLAHEILSGARRRPRIVLKNTLQLDPLIDVVLNRLPNRFINPVASKRRPGADPVSAIASLAADMGPGDALLIFPEGGNFTEERRRRRIEHLREKGDLEAASRAESLTHLLLPHTAGAFAALDACPDADAVYTAHAGLDDLDQVDELWRAIPQENRLTVAWTLVPREQVPPEDEREAWLLDTWTEMDAWVAAEHAARKIAIEGSRSSEG
jgi:1-acyl-sn-glycerol-3-phosphate acyltransferase